MSTWPNTKEYCEKILADVTEEQRYKILRGNAILRRYTGHHHNPHLEARTTRSRRSLIARPTTTSLRPNTWG